MACKAVHFENRLDVSNKIDSCVAKYLRFGNDREDQPEQYRHSDLGPSSQDTRIRGRADSACGIEETPVVQSDTAHKRLG